jgi:hypothetical protein
MTAISGNNYTKAFINVPAERPNVGEYGGAVKVLFDAYTGTPSAADVLSVGKIPSGARILTISSFVGMGAAPTFSKVDSLGAPTVLAVGDVLLDESIIKVTAAGGGYTANPFGFITYTVV